MTDPYIWILTTDLPPETEAATETESEASAGLEVMDAVPKGLGDALFGEPGVRRTWQRQANANLPVVDLPNPPQRVKVEVDKVGQSMTDLLDGVGQILQRVQTSAAELAGMQLEEIELSVEVNGQGQVSLLGMGGQVGGKGGITLKFKRDPNPPQAGGS